jgi:hypothetical protein
MTVKRGDREGNLFTGSPGGKPPRKNLLGQKREETGPDRSYTSICSKENKRKEEKFRTPW